MVVEIFTVRVSSKPDMDIIDITESVASKAIEKIIFRCFFMFVSHPVFLVFPIRSARRIFAGLISGP